MKFYNSAGVPVVSQLGGAPGGGGVALSAGTQSVSTGTVVFSNSNRITFGMSGSSRVTASYLGINFSAGTTKSDIDQVIFSNSNNVSFGYDNSSITASASFAAETPFGVSAGTQSVSTGTLVFSNSNNVTFGMSGSSRVTASASFPAETPFGVSAGTQSVSTGTLVFSDSNGISFGMSGSSRITASYTVPSETPFGISAGTQSVSTGTLVFSNSNNVTFGMSGSSRVTASASFAAETPFGVSAGTQSVSTGTLVFSNSNNVTFGMSGSSRVTASASFPAETPFGISAGTQSVSTGTMVFSDSNGISFGMSGSSRITASHNGLTTQTNQQMTMFATGNTTLSSTGTSNASSLVFRGSGAASVGITNGSVLIDVQAGAAAITQSIGMSTETAGGATGGTSGYATGDDILYHFVPGSNITFSQSVNGASGTLSIYGPSAGGAATLSSYEPYEARGASTGAAGIPTATSAAVNVYPIYIADYLSAGALNFIASMSFSTVGTSSGRQTAGMRFGVYSRGTGTNSTTIGSITSTKWEWSITGNNSSYSISQATRTAYTGYGFLQTNSAGVNITSGYTGMKLIQVPINTLITPGQYYVALMGTNSTSSVNVGISLSTRGFVLNTGATALAPMGSFSTSFSRAGDNKGGAWPFALGSWTSAGSVTGLPASMALTSISYGLTQIPFMSFWST